MESELYNYFYQVRSHYQQKMRSLFSAKFRKGVRVACSLAYRSFCVGGKECDWVVFGYAIALCSVIYAIALINIIN
ncbi:hypothetical protein ACE1CI_09940 [Aerosakkonemataceae cyanobacterium BLCC-F50]|uniref:Uncharacterized protein n=1 Tax=Floridaenema flaviceps BLCC-F50 TaxID=3153642 RepID=A0ABV4XNH0_9CYAN